METAAYESLQRLDGYQKSVIYGLYKEDDRTAKLRSFDGTVLWLEQNAIIEKVTDRNEVSDFHNATSLYILQPWVTEALKINEELQSAFRMAHDQYEMKYRNEQGESCFSGPYYGHLYER